MTDTKECGYCKKEFQRTYINQKYCKDSCRVRKSNGITKDRYHAYKENKALQEQLIQTQHELKAAREGLRYMEGQITQTQQALESSLQTNKVLMDRLGMAMESLREITVMVVDRSDAYEVLDMIKTQAKASLKAMQG